MYKLVQKLASVDDFVRLREVAGLTVRPRAAAEKGLPNTLYGVTVKLCVEVVGMGRIVGDGGLNFEVVDIAVDPRHQGKGNGRLIMQSVMDYLESEVPEGACLTLMADVPELYKKFGFKLTRPRSEGMYKIR